MHAPTSLLPCTPTSAVVVVLSPDFVRKKWPMRELAAALARPPRDPVATCQGGEGEPVTLLPVLVEGLTTEHVGDAQKRLYSLEAWPKNRERPPDDVLRTWAALLARVATIVCIREDQVSARGPRTCRHQLNSWAGGAPRPIVGI